jgi:hypothetical protein
MRMLPLRQRLRVGLLGKFALASLLPVVLLGVVLAQTMGGEIRQRALADARQSAQLIDLSLVQPQLSAADLTAGLSERRIRTLDRALQASLAGKEIARIKIWNRQIRVVYASDHPIIGHTFPVSEELRTALAGTTASEVSDLRRAENANDRSFGQLLEVYTPLRFGTAARPAGAFELYLPYRGRSRRRSRTTRGGCICSLPGGWRCSTSSCSASSLAPRPGCGGRQQKTSTSPYTILSPTSLTAVSSTTEPRRRSWPPGVRARVWRF